MENKEQKVGPGKFVAFTYRLTNADNGELLFEARREAPDTMVYGVTNEVVPGLQNVMKDLRAGDRYSITLPPEAAFGQRFDDNVISLPLSTFERDGKVAEEVKPGAVLPMMTEEGYTVTGRVVEMTPEKVIMDFNHPFAGLTVTFDGEVAEVRDATPEELNPKHGCGCGCSHGHNEDCAGECGCHGDDSDCGCHGDDKADGCGCGSSCGCGH